MLLSGVELLCIGVSEAHCFANAVLSSFVGSLCCDSAEEAKTLIPSIADKIDDDTLQELLDQMAKLQG